MVSADTLLLVFEDPGDILVEVSADNKVDVAEPTFPRP